MGGFDWRQYGIEMGIGAPLRIARNVASGDKWDQGVLNAVVSGVLWGSVGALQVKPAAKDKLDFLDFAFLTSASPD